MFRNKSTFSKNIACVLLEKSNLSAETRNFEKAFLIQDRDKSNTGKISLDQLGDIFRIYQVWELSRTDQEFMSCWGQVEVNAANVEKYLDNQGELTRDDFVKVAQDHKLLEFERQGVTAVTGAHETFYSAFWFWKVFF